MARYPTWVLRAAISFLLTTGCDVPRSEPTESRCATSSLDLVVMGYSEEYAREPPARLEIFLENSVSNAITIGTSPLHCEGSEANSTDVSCVEVEPLGSLQAHFDLLGDPYFLESPHWLYLTFSRAGEIPVTAKAGLDLHVEPDPNGECAPVVRGSVFVAAGELVPL